MKTPSQSDRKTTILILCNVVLAPVPIHSLSSPLKYPTSFSGKFEFLNSAVTLRLFIRLRWGFHWKSYTSHLDITIAVTWDVTKTNEQVIYQPTSLPSFVTFYAFYFCARVWPKTVCFERYGRKNPSNRPL